MGDVVALPLASSRTAAAVLPDARGEHRALQVTWHTSDDVVVLSMWRGGQCSGTVRLSPEDAAALIGTLAEGLARRG
ncbi:MAG: hypothetical protein JWP95_1617 [Actinotalea sp.]|nr:hypothetical protein [Actinotalea sp.]